ncbi:MAG: hypothetical protein M3513_09325, partial [Actinomycetota bacterium]|nr:hypothetical protein [Actinomycetota bacterium]
QRRLRRERGEPDRVHDEHSQGFLRSISADLARGEQPEHHVAQERAELIVIDGMGHALAEEPGTEPAPQTAHAAEVDEHAVRWLRRHLVDAGRR